MPNQTDRWEQTPGTFIARQPFQARNSTDSRHLDVERRRNQDVEEAARDRLIFRWVLLLFSLLAVLGIMILIIRGMPDAEAGHGVSRGEMPDCSKDVIFRHGMAGWPSQPCPAPLSAHWAVIRVL